MRRPSPLLLGLLFVLIAVRWFAFRLDHEALWHDEAFTHAMISHSWAWVLRFARIDVHPPLYYLLEKALVTVIGDSPAKLRVLSVVFATGVVALGVAPVRRLFGDRAGFVYCVIALFAPGLMAFAQEARMYSMACFFVVAGTLYGLLAVRENKPADWFGFVILSLAGAYTHYFALLALSISGVLLLVHAIAHRRSLTPTTLPRLLWSAGAALLLYLPWLPALLAQVRVVRHGFWIPPINAKWLLWGLVAPFSTKFDDVTIPWLPLTLMVLSIAATVYALIRIARRTPERHALIHIALVWVLTFVSAIAISKAITPVFVPRYMIACAGLVFVAVAVGVSQPRSGWLQTGLVVVFLALSLPVDIATITRDYNGPFAQLQTEIEPKLGADDMIVHDQILTLYPLFVRMPNVQQAVKVLPDDPMPAMGNPVFETHDGVLPNPRKIVFAADERAIAAWHRPFWLIQIDDSWSPIDARIFEQAGFTRTEGPLRFAPSYSFVKVTLTKWAPSQ